MKKVLMGNARKVWRGLIGIGCLWLLCFSSVSAQQEQRIDVVIKDFTFHTQQVPLQLAVPTVISIMNQDAERHDFGSHMFRGILTKIESGGVTSYGKDVGGVLIDPEKEAVIRFSIERPGKYEFRCSMHPKMKGEIWLMNVGRV